LLHPSCWSWRWRQQGPQKRRQDLPHPRHAKSKALNQDHRGFLTKFGPGSYCRLLNVGKHTNAHTGNASHTNHTYRKKTDVLPLWVIHRRSQYRNSVAPDGRMTNDHESEALWREWSIPSSGNVLVFAWKNYRNCGKKNSVIIDGVTAEVRIEHLLNKPARTI
jgi:hypothetical protein